MGTVKKEAVELTKRLVVLFKWVAFSLICGIVVGFVSVLVVKSINYVTTYRNDNFWTIFSLPIVGVIIVFLYKVTGREKDSGTNMVLNAIRSQNTIHLRTTPLIIISTILTHFAGGSSGREGAALQFGGSLGESIGRLFGFNSKDRTIIIMCGMSAAFSAVFGVPLAAVIFPMEVVSVGIMYYSALVPCTVASLAARQVAVLCGVTSSSYNTPSISSGLSVKGVGVVFLLSICCAVVSIVFCQLLHFVQKYAEKNISNAYIRIAIGGAVVIILTLIFGTDYNGMGGEIITKAVEQGTCYPAAFLLKIVFTVFTLSFGFKGGEIVPSFFVGATFGCFFGLLLGFDPALCAAIGMIAVFCGVTNCPLTSLFIACELFGFDGCEYYLLAVGITYVISGYFSLYNSQKIVYSKTEPTFIDRKAN